MSIYKKLKNINDLSIDDLREFAAEHKQSLSLSDGKGKSINVRFRGYNFYTGEPVVDVSTSGQSGSTNEAHETYIVPSPEYALPNLQAARRIKK